MIPVGLRIDVDTLRGTRDGVPRLLHTLARHDTAATFFVSLGPDNMGRHLWRLLQPQFLAKMWRSGAPGLYGWEILLAGTCWPGREIGPRFHALFRSMASAGHEVGLHAWDHYRWQTHLERLDVDALREEIRRGVEGFADALGRMPDCSAAAGWRCDARVLKLKESFAFRYNSDCRGSSIFRPRIGGVVCAPQVPVTLPTFDEAVGRDGVTVESYNDRVLEAITPGALNVLTVHAEVEGIACAQMFEDFLAAARARDIRFLTLGELAAACPAPPLAGIRQAPIPGRAGNVCWQAALAA